MASHELVSLLSSEGRDFLVRNGGEQVGVSTLVGKVVGLYFSGSWCGPCRRFTPDLIQVYEQLRGKEDFELVFISSDRDEEAFIDYFSKMPWLAVPFADSATRKKIKDLFEISGIPALVILDENGKVSCADGRGVVMEYEADGYPFTRERIQFLKNEEEALRDSQSITPVLVSPDRDYVISNSGNEIPVSELEGKIVGLYFSIDEICHDFTVKLVKVYEKLKENGESFEIVSVSLESDLESFEEGFKIMPWLGLPFHDRKCRKLVRYFGLRVLPTLVIIGRDGKMLQSNVVDLVEDHGVESYPFTEEKLRELEEIEKARLESQTLESLLISGELDHVIGKDGSKVGVRDLVGKNIVLYFSAHWCPPCRAFLPKLISAYEEIKSKDDKFEIIFVSSDADQSAFEKFYATMPWLSLPFGDPRKNFLERRFKVDGIPAAVAIDPSGRTVTREVRDLVETHGADAYPFTEERVKLLLAEEEDGKAGWVCDGDVCRKAT